MKRIVFSFSLFLILIVSNGVFANFPQKNNDRQKLNFYVDYASFRGDEDGIKEYLETYISIPNYQLSYQKKGDIFFAAYEITVSLFDKNKKLAAHKTWQGFSRIDSLSQAEKTMTLDLAAFMVPPAHYAAKIHVSDLNAEIAGDAEIPVDVRSFAENKLSLSDVQFARNIQKAKIQNKFVKNGIEVIPNPSRAFGIESPFIYFYGEIYHIPQTNEKYHPLTKTYYLVDYRGDTVKTSTKKIAPRGSSIVWAGKINILDIISGRYDLYFVISDSSKNMSVEQKADLWINNPYKMLTFKQYRQEDIDEFKAQIYYIVDESERDFFDKLETPAQINYINNFWKNLDPDFRTEHLKRFYIAQERFGSPTIPGWKTDRGRVYIMYGPPDDVDRYPASLSTRAYEIWYYEHMKGQAQVQFVFVDLGIQGNYQLVHCDLKSSDRFEIYNPNWREDILISR